MAVPEESGGASGPVTPAPCLGFELDVEATTFNICKHCGLARAVHSDFSRASEELKGKLAKRDGKNSPREAATKSRECCSAFRRDLAGTSFDTCVCGFPKSAHEIKGHTYGAGKELERKLTLKAKKSMDDERESDKQDDRANEHSCHCAIPCSIM